METTTYYARVLKDDWALALDILADIFTESALDDEELERERDVILQEIAAANDQPDDLVFDLAQNASYGDHPLGRSILGTAELIAAVDREKMLAWRDRNYWASRIVVAAAGNIDHAKIRRSGGKTLWQHRARPAAAARAAEFFRHRAEGAKAPRPNSCSAFICRAKLP